MNTGGHETPRQVVAEGRWLIGGVIAAMLLAIALIPGTGASAAKPESGKPGHVQPVRGEAENRQPRVGTSGARRGGEQVYKVRGNRLLGGRVTSTARKFWKRFKQLIPRSERGFLKKFAVFKGGFAAAYVNPLRDPKKWKLGIWRGLRKNEVDFTLIHEFGHLLTLKASQVPPGGPRGSACGTYNPGEGCALPGSYLAQYVDEYWQGTGRLAEWRKAIKDGRKGERAFYKKYKDEFVTPYSAAHPAEDIAEAFAAYIVAPAPSGSTVADRKRRFFGRFPELVQLRERIQRANPRGQILF